jgi:hypothetical protein
MLLVLHAALEIRLPVFVAMALSGVCGLALYAALLRLLFADAWSDVRMVAAHVGRVRSLLLLPTRLWRMRAPASAERAAEQPRG